MPLPDPPVSIDLSPLGGGSRTAPAIIEIPGSNPAPTAPDRAPSYPPAPVWAGARFLSSLLALPVELRAQALAALGGGAGGGISEEDLQAAIAELGVSAILERLDNAPIPAADDLDKLSLTNPVIGQTYAITGEGGRIERFIGNVPDTSRFFVTGMAPIEVEGELLAVSGLFKTETEGTYFFYGTAESGGQVYFYQADSTSPWSMVSSPNFGSESVIFSASTVTQYPWQVQEWNPNGGIDAELIPSNFVQWDNSGFLANLESAAPYYAESIGSSFKPNGLFNNKPTYASCKPGSEGLLTWGIDGLTEGGAWEFLLGEYQYYSSDDVPYPWLASTWTLASQGEAGNPTAALVATRAPAANPKSWITDRNTISLTVINNRDYDFVIQGAMCAQGESTFIGFVDPLNISTVGSTTAAWPSVIAFSGGSEINISYAETAPEWPISLIYNFPSGAETNLYFF